MTLPDQGPYRTAPAPEEAPVRPRRWVLRVLSYLFAVGAGIALTVCFYTDMPWLIGGLMAGLFGGAVVTCERLVRYGDPAYWFCKHEKLQTKVDDLEAQQRRQETMRRLGRKFVELGVTQEHYDALVASLQRDMDNVGGDMKRLFGERRYTVDPRTGRVTRRKK